MRTQRSRLPFLIVVAALLGAAALLPPIASGQATKAPAPQQANTDASKVFDTEQFLGEFNVGGQRYSVLAHVKALTHASDLKFAATLGEIEIRDAHQTAVYQKGFPFEPQNGRFARTLLASASVFTGGGGSALAIRYLEDPAPAGRAESWQVFVPANGKLALLGAPLPPGGSTNLAVGGVLTGVMVSGGVNVMPLASKAEALEFRAWSGNFFVFVPIRVDWAEGQWGEGEQCFTLDSGTLRKTGCNMRSSAIARPSGSHGGAVMLYEAPVEDKYHGQQVEVETGTPVEVLDARAVVNWRDLNDRVSCTFEDMWIRVRVHGDIGWVHSQEDFTTLGLPETPPPQ